MKFFILALVIYGAVAAPSYDLDEEDDISMDVEENPYDAVSYKKHLKIVTAKRGVLQGAFDFPKAGIMFDLQFTPGKGGKFALADSQGKNLITEEYTPTKNHNFYNVLRTVMNHQWKQYSKQDDSLILNNLETNEEVKAPASIHEMENTFFSSNAVMSLPALSHALGQAGHSGNQSPVAMWLHKIAMKVGEVNDRAAAFHPSDSLRDNDSDDLTSDMETGAQGWWRKKGCDKSICGTVPSASGKPCECCGKCGKKCNCWWLVCRNCKWNKGCFVHDYCECAHGYGGKCFWGAFDAFLHCGGCKKCTMGCPGYSNSGSNGSNGGGGGGGGGGCRRRRLLMGREAMPCGD